MVVALSPQKAQKYYYSKSSGFKSAIHFCRFRVREMKEFLSCSPTADNLSQKGNFSRFLTFSSQSGSVLCTLYRYFIGTAGPNVWTHPSLEFKIYKTATVRVKKLVFYHIYLLPFRKPMLDLLITVLNESKQLAKQNPVFPLFESPILLLSI